MKKQLPAKQKQEQGLHVNIPASFKEDALHLQEIKSYEQWEVIGAALAGLTNSRQWWIGDWLNFGKAKWGEKYAQAMDILGLDYGLLANYSWVSSTFPESARVRGASWTIHFTVASINKALITDKQRFALVEEAADKEWSKSDLVAEIKKRFATKSIDDATASRKAKAEKRAEKSATDTSTEEAGAPDLSNGDKLNLAILELGHQLQLEKTLTLLEIVTQAIAWVKRQQLS